MESEEIFLGNDVVEATLKGWEKYPGQAFYSLPPKHGRSPKGRKNVTDIFEANSAARVERRVSDDRC
jgi:hypothetical protein